MHLLVAAGHAFTRVIEARLMHNAHLSRPTSRELCTVRLH